MEFAHRVLNDEELEETEHYLCILGGQLRLPAVRSVILTHLIVAIEDVAASGYARSSRAEWPSPGQ